MTAVADIGPKLIELSASQIKTSEECLRKWAFHYLSGLEDPGTPATLLGNDCHRVWERWELEGLAPQQAAEALNTDPGYHQRGDLKRDTDYTDRVASITTAALHKIPVPGTPGVQVEGRFSFTINGISYRGYKDLTYWKERPEGLIRILHDYKTTSHFKWAKTQEQLRSDVQMNLYAKTEFDAWDIQELEANWLYVSTGAEPSTKLVHVTVTRSAVEDHYGGKIEPQARKLLKLYDERPNPNDLPLPEDLSICEAYRGCPYKQQCKRTPQDTIKAAWRNATVKASPKMDFFKRAKQVDATAPAPKVEAAKAAPPPIVAQVAAIAQAAAAPPSSLRERLKQPPPSPGAVGVVPPEPATTPLAERLAASVAPEAVTEAAAPPPKKAAGPGRPRKTVTEALEREAASVAASVLGYTLYVNCLPVGRPVTQLSELLAPLAAQVADQLGVPDYRLTDYGKGKDALVYALGERLKQDPIAGAVFCDTRTAEGAMCANTLAQYAADVVQGV